MGTSFSIMFPLLNNGNIIENDRGDEGGTLCFSSCGDDSEHFDERKVPDGSMEYF